MIERWIVASLLIVALVAARQLLRHAVRPRDGGKTGERADTCLSSGCTAGCEEITELGKRRTHHASG